MNVFSHTQVADLNGYPFEVLVATSQGDHDLSFRIFNFLVESEWSGEAVILPVVQDAETYVFSYALAFTNCETAVAFKLQFS